MKLKLTAAILAGVALLAVALPASASCRSKPFHCHYDYTGRSWSTYFLPAYVLHCDRVW